MDLSIVIPMFNEAENAETTLNRLEEALASFQGTFEMVAVNDGSTDQTSAILMKLSEKNARLRVVSYSGNKGRGMALREGFKASIGEIVVSIDADLSYDPRYIHDLVDKLRVEPDVDFVLASPYMPGGEVQDVPFLRLWVSKVGNKVLRCAMPNRVYTSTGIFRAYRRKVLDSLELESDGKEIHLEILSKAIAIGYRVKEVPAILTSRRKGTSKFKFKKTAASHLAFSFFEKPMIVFGFLGMISLLAGCLMGLYVAYLRYAGTLTPGRPLVTFALLLILGGIQILSFGFIAIQILTLRREILRIQRGNKELMKEIEGLREGSHAEMEVLKTPQWHSDETFWDDTRKTTRW
jgi:dolichol-phosphate mannosyltransferase